jgi:trimeric autotransporter adhesin
VGNGAGVTNVDAATLQGVSAAGFWRLDGNLNTSAGRSLLGTLDNQPLEIKVNNVRALRLEPTTDGSANIIGGSADNFAGSDLHGVVIAGGGAASGVVLSNATLSPLTTISGGAGHKIAGASPYATIGGGYLHEIEAGSDGATVSGGRGNVVRESSIGGTISGGQNNTILSNGDHSTIGGGFSNTILAGADMATIAGGYGNRVAPAGAIGAIGGGYENTILTNTQFGTVPGGYQNSAGHSAFAAGTRAKAIHRGAFVWADSGGAEFASTDVNQFLVRATGGVGIGTNNPATTLHVHGTDQTVAIVSGSRTTGTFLGIQNTSTGGARWSLVSTGSGNGEGAGRLLFFTHASNDTKMRLEPNGNLVIDGSLTQSSDRARKEEVEAVDGGSVLEKVAAMPISTWKYKDDDAGARHLGPMAQDFHAAFGLGESEKGISAVDADGVALAAIQGLNKKVEEQKNEIAQLRETVQRLEQLIANSASK